MYVAVREPRVGGLLSRADDVSAIGRYRRRKLEITDEFGGATTRRRGGDLDLRVLWEGEALDGYQSIEVARIARTGSERSSSTRTSSRPACRWRRHPHWAGSCG